MAPIDEDRAASILDELPTNFPAQVHGIPIVKAADNRFIVDGEETELSREEAAAVLGKRCDWDAFRLVIGGDRPYLKGEKPPIIKRTKEKPIITIPAIYPNTLRAISVGGAFGYFILAFNNEKPGEERTWPTSYRGLTLIHVSQTSEWEYSFKNSGITRKDCPKSSIIGAANVTDCRDLGEGFWLHVMQPIALFQPPILKVPGARNYWKPLRDEQVKGFNTAWAELKRLGKV